MDRRRVVIRLTGGGVLLSLLALGLVAYSDGAAWRAWLAAALLISALPTGGLLLWMMTRLIPGGWRESLARPFARLASTVPVTALAMAPILFAPSMVYGWAHGTQSAGFRAIYLAPLFFAARGIVWLMSLGLFAWWMRIRPDARPAVIGLLALVTASLPIATDWAMSLDADFASTGFGLYLLSIQMLLALSLALGWAVRDEMDARRKGVLAGVLFAAAALWAYFAFMHFFVIWSGDQAPGASWYERRARWSALLWAAAALKAATGLMIFDPLRRRARLVRLVCACSVAGAVAEMGWMVLPATGAGAAAGLRDFGLYLLAALGLGAVSLGAVMAWRPQGGAS